MTLWSIPQDDTPDGVFLFPVCTDRQTLTKILSVLYFGIFEAGYGDDPTVMYPILEAMAFMEDPENAPCVASIIPDQGDTPQQTIDRTLFSMGIDLCVNEEDSECEEDMSCKPLKINGKFYFPIDCGCGDTQLLALGEPVQLDDAGNPISIENGGEFGGGFSTGEGASGSWDGTVSSGNADCYATNGTAYILQRAKEFWYALIDFFVVGTAVKTPSLERNVNIPQMFSALASGSPDVDYIRTIGKIGVDAVLGNAAFVTRMEDEWQFSGSVNKSQLKDWFWRGATNSVSGFAAQVMMNTWADYNLFISMNSDLQEIAANCEFDFSSGLGFTYTWAQDFDFKNVGQEGTNPGGTTDGVFVADVGWTKGAGSEGDRIEFIFPDNGLELTGIRIFFSRVPVGDAQRVRLNQGEDNANTQTDFTGIDVDEYVDAVIGTYPNGVWFLFNENNLPAANTDMAIERVILYGNGTRPTTGQVII